MTDDEGYRKRRRKPVDSCDLYAIACLWTRRVKFGRAASVWHRHQQLQAGSGAELILLAFAPGLGRFEETLHDWFADRRLHGEWFHPSVTRELAEAVPVGRYEGTTIAGPQFSAWVLKIAQAYADTLPTPGTFEWRGRTRTA